MCSAICRNLPEIEMGFTVLMPGLRGHGESTGHYIGMGWHNRLDMLRWIDEIVRDDPEAEIVLFGISMGGATVMMTSGEALPPNVKVIVEDCGYTSVLPPSQNGFFRKISETTLFAHMMAWCSRVYPTITKYWLF